MMRIVGYTDRISVQPGQKIGFKVSSQAPSYRADVVRLIHGDENPAGPGFKDELIESAVNGDYPGREQRLYIGSYATVPDSPALRQSGSFTLQCWIYPTTPELRAQGILTKWSDADGSGYGLFVGEDGGLSLWLGGGDGKVERIGTGVPLRAAQWYLVAGVYDASSNRVSLYQQPVSIWPRDDSQSVTQSSVQLSSIAGSDAPFLMAGHWGREDTGKDVVQGHFNGKIDSPRLYSRALSADEVASLGRDAPPDQTDGLVAAWDFGRDFSSSTVTDASPNSLHGEAVNMPARAMTGHNWRGNEADFRNATAEYGAIYFHDDDLEDAGWETDFELTVPEEMRSGVYAARLRIDEDEGGEDYVTFFVRPKKGTSSAPIVFLAPTCSYLAYANSHTPSHPINQARYQRLGGRPFEYPQQPQDKFTVEHKLLSLYDRHTDDAGVAYSSRLRPILNMRPKYFMQSLAMGEGAPHQLNADLHLLDWMEQKGYEFDVVTDEDLHFEGTDLLARYLVVVTGSHPEYWTGQMLDSLEAYQADGGRLMYLGGNGFYWITSFAPDRPHVIEIRRWRGTETWEADPGEFHHSTTGEMGGLWRARGRPPQKYTGVGFSAQGLDYSVPFHKGPDRMDPRAAFIFEGVGPDEVIGDFGLVMGGAGGFEVDRADADLGTPPHALVTASASGFSDAYQHVVEEVLISDSRQGGTVNPLVKGDLLFFEGPNGGGVFSVGSISWCGSLSHNDYDNNVSRITGNVLTRFASEDPIT